MFNLKKISGIFAQSREPEKGNYLGIDIGRYSVKVVSLLKNGRNKILNKCFLKDIPGASDDKEKIKSVVAEAVKPFYPGKYSVNLSLPGSDVISRFITLPKMSLSELKNSMMFEADKYIPFNVNEVIMGFYILDYSRDGQMNIILSAAKKDVIKERLDLVSGLGMSVNVLDVDTFALFNAMNNSRATDDNAAICHIDLGFSKTNIIISAGNVPRFTRSIPIGGEDIAAMIAEESGISQSKAEEIKLTNGAGFDDKIRSASNYVLDEIIKECQLSFGYFEDKSKMTVSLASFSGGLIKQEGIKAYLIEKLGSRLEENTSLPGITVDSGVSMDDITSRFAVASGLALRD